MAMAQVFIPGPCDSIPPLLPPATSSSLLPPTTSPSLPPPTSPPLAIPSLPEDDIVSYPPPAPPPSPEMLPRRLGSIFEISPKMFETPRRCELPPSPTNSLDFSTLFTPNKSPLVSEPDSPTHLTPGDFPDSGPSPPHLISPFSSPPAVALNIPTSPLSGETSGYSTMLSHSHSEGNSFQGIRSQTALAQHSKTFDNSLLERPSHPLRPRSHTHPSRSLAPHATYLSEQLQQKRLEVQQVHPHLPLSFEATQLSQSGPEGQIADSGYHEEDLPSPRKKFSKKRKSDELGLDSSSQFYSCDSYSPSSSESSWLVIHSMATYPQGKKACQEGEYVVRRQSASFSGGLTLPGAGFTDGCNFSAPPTPNPSLEGSRLHNSLLLPSSLSPHHGSSTLDITPTFTPDPLSSLQSMEVADMEDVQEPDNRLDSLDSMDCGLSEQNETNEMECLTNTLRGSHLGRGQAPSSLHHQLPHALPQILAGPFSPPAVAPTMRCHSSGEGHADFSQTPQFPVWLAQRSAHPSFSYHRGDGVLGSIGSAESKFVLSKSL